MPGVEERIRDAGEDLATKVRSVPSFEDVIGHGSPRAPRRALIAIASFAIFLAAAFFAWKAFAPSPTTSPGADADVFMAVDPHTPNAVMAALLRSALVVRDGCVLVGNGSDLSLPIWPKGYTASLDGSGRIEILDADGQVVAVQGQTFDMGGGYVAEFQPANKVAPKEQQIASVDSGLGYQLPAACVSEIYGIWQVGDTTPVAQAMPASSPVTDDISVSYLPDGYSKSDDTTETLPDGAQIHSVRFNGRSGAYEVYAMRRPEPLDLGSDLGFKVNVHPVTVAGHDAYLLTAANGSDEMAVVEWQEGPLIVKVFGLRVSSDALLRVADGVTIDSSTG
jgi:hypothetical protein